MGLDNGIVIKNFDMAWKSEFEGLDKYDFRDNGDCSVCYWRKCWNVRDIFMQTLHMKDDDCTHNIDADDIPAILRGYRKLMNPEVWDSSYSSNWTYEEYFDVNLNSLINLKMLKKYIEAHPGCEVYFYDSY